MSDLLDIDLDNLPIESQASRAAKQVDVTELLLVKLMSGFEPSPALLREAVKLGIDIEAVRLKVEELCGDSDDY